MPIPSTGNVITKIHGFSRKIEDLKSVNTQLKVRESIRVEADRPDRSLAEVAFWLPSFSSGPGSTTYNPQQLTFTLLQSRHPYSNLYILDSLDSMKRAPGEDHMWDIGVTYSTPEPVVRTNQARRSQRVRKPDGDPEDQTPITNPTERPAEFDGNIKTVNMQRYVDLNNRPILHTNGIPVEKPITFAVNAQTWTWDFNVPVESFKTLVERANECTGAVNSRTFDVDIGRPGQKLQIEQGKLRCEGITYSEMWETPSGSDTEYHYVKAKATFLYNQYVDWGIPPLSSHTHCYDNTTNKKIINCKVNALGTEAKRPWPLKSDGTQVGFDELDGFNPDDFGRLQAGGDELKTIIEADLYTKLFVNYGFKFPRVDA